MQFIPLLCNASDGRAVEKLTSEELDAFHPDYPVATCIGYEK